MTEDGLFVNGIKSAITSEKFTHSVSRTLKELIETFEMLQRMLSMLTELLYETEKRLDALRFSQQVENF